MVEASSVFIVYEFLQQYFPSPELFSSGVFFILIWGGLALLMTAIVLLLQNSSDKMFKAIHACAFAVGILAGFIFVVAVIRTVQSGLSTWAVTVLRITPQQFYVYLFMSVFGVISFALGFASLFMSKEPHNDSTLNSRQKAQAFAALSGLVFVGIGLWYWANEVFSTLVIAILIVVEILSILMWFYDPLIYALSRIFPRKPKAALEPTPGKINRFAIVVCARNEEKVIGLLIDSLHAMSYPRSKYDIIVVCDSCTDRTIDIAKEKGTIAMERKVLGGRGKGNALNWIFDVFQDMKSAGDVYDAYVVIDADNLVNEQYLSEINAHLNQGHEIMQTYLGSKNPNDTWVSRSYSITYWLANSQYQNAHSRLNLSAQLSSTGMVFRASIFEELSWEPDSLTEDLAFTTRYVLYKDKPCHWVDSARLYDEKPLTLRVSYRQRTRWMQGRMNAMMRYVPRLLFSSIRNLSFKQLDIALYLIRPFFVLVAFVVYALRLMLFIVFPDNLASAGFLVNFETAAVLLLAYILTQVYILSAEDRQRYIPWLPLQYVFSYTWLVPIFRGLLKHRERYWVSTFHARDIKISDVREDILISEARKRLAGLDNLHMLPLGQILLKAAVITGDELQAGLLIQEKEGGFLGNILVENGSISERTLVAYVNIQQVMRKSSKIEAEDNGDGDQAEFEKLQIGQILRDAEVISEEQLHKALEYQDRRGIMLGESIVELNIIPDEILSIFLEVQSLIGAHYLNDARAHHLVREINQMGSSEDAIEELLLDGGLISKQQLNAARIYQEARGESLVNALMALGYMSSETLETLENLMKATTKEVPSQRAHTIHQSADITDREASAKEPVSVRGSDTQDRRSS